jgi:hypothetical protein
MAHLCSEFLSKNPQGSIEKRRSGTCNNIHGC